MFGSLNAVAGSHEYVVAPEAVSMVLLPLQIVVVPATLITGIGVTVTVTVAVTEQPLLVPVTV